MTTIVGVANRFFCDSAMTMGNVCFESMSKIKAFDSPFEMVIPNDAAVLEGLSRILVHDIIHGWTVTGSQEPAEKFVDMLQVFCLRKDTMKGLLRNIRVFLATYWSAIRFKLANFENLFEVVLIGEKANYSVRFEPLHGKDTDKTVMENVVEILPRENGFVLGSGAEIFLQTAVNAPNQKKKISTVTAIYRVMSLDPGTSGPIHVWELKDVEGGKRLQHVSMYAAASMAEAQELSKDLYVIHTPALEAPKQLKLKALPVRFKNLTDGKRIANKLIKKLDAVKVDKGTQDHGKQENKSIKAVDQVQAGKGPGSGQDSSSPTRAARGRRTRSDRERSDRSGSRRRRERKTTA